VERLIRAAGALLLVVGSCGEGAVDSGGGFSPDPERTERVAWVGLCADGTALVVEPLAPAHHPELAFVREESVLREVLGIDAQATLLRVHACAGSGLPRGTARTPAGKLLEPLGEPPEELAPRERLIWYAVALGGAGAWDGPVAGETRSYLLVGEGTGRDKPDHLDWSQGGRTSRLERMDWNERERREYLTTAFPPQATEATPLQPDGETLDNDG